MLNEVAYKINTNRRKYGKNTKNTKQTYCIYTVSGKKDATVFSA